MAETILPYSSLIDVPVVENNEPLVVTQETTPEVVWRYEKQDMVTALQSEKMYLRSGALGRLRDAAAWLDRHLPGARLRVVHAYRLPSIQEEYFSARLAKFRAQHPEMTDLEIRELSHTLSASPDVAGHPTGGAVDLIIATDRGNLDMGTAIADFRDENLERIKTFCTDLTDAQRTNRALLRSIMMHAGFAPYNGEWWHFSYGDREWAAYYRLPNATYGPIDLLRTP
ncbi:dipeptidase [Patescibacteria group bacterium]|nr:MAG: dipeptidase [Patescibacteria group bacterium]